MRLFLSSLQAIVFGQNGCIWTKAVVLGHNGCIVQPLFPKYNHCAQIQTFLPKNNQSAQIQWLNHFCWNTATLSQIELFCPCKFNNFYPNTTTFVQIHQLDTTILPKCNYFCPKTTPLAKYNHSCPDTTTVPKYNQIQLLLLIQPFCPNTCTTILVKTTTVAQTLLPKYMYNHFCLHVNKSSGQDNDKNWTYITMNDNPRWLTIIPHEMCDCWPTNTTILPKYNHSCQNTTIVPKYNPFCPNTTILPKQNHFCLNPTNPPKYNHSCPSTTIVPKHYHCCPCKTILFLEIQPLFSNYKNSAQIQPAFPKYM